MVGSDSPRALATADDPWLSAAVMKPTFLVTYATLIVACDTHRVTTFWPADALVLALLLNRPTKTWWQGLLAGFAGLVIARLMSGCPPIPALMLSTINSVEILTCAGILRTVAPRALDLKRPSHAALFLASAAVAALTSAIPAVEFLGQTGGISFWPTFRTWYEGDALGLLIGTPAILATVHLLQQPWTSASVSPRL